MSQSIEINPMILCQLGLDDFSIVPMPQSGVTTEVFQLQRGQEIFFLRILPAGISARPQILVHEILLAKGVIVPVIVHSDDFVATLSGRSYMVVKNIGGRSVADLHGTLSTDEIDQILLAAGQQLALINSVPVAGFGPILPPADTSQSLTAAADSYQTWLADIMLDLNHLVRSGHLEPSTAAALKSIHATHPNQFNYPSARLCHGDFDLTHIFADQGRYTGLIDLGDIGGYGPYHDLAHFCLYAEDYLPVLLNGYQTVSTLAPDYQKQIWLIGLFMAVKELAFWTGKASDDYPTKSNRYQVLLKKFIQKTLPILSNI